MIKSSILSFKHLSNAAFKLYETYRLTKGPIKIKEEYRLTNTTKKMKQKIRVSNKVADGSCAK